MNFGNLKYFLYAINIVGSLLIFAKSSNYHYIDRFVDYAETKLNASKSFFESYITAKSKAKNMGPVLDKKYLSEAYGDKPFLSSPIQMKRREILSENCPAYLKLHNLTEIRKL